MDSFFHAWPKPRSSNSLKMLLIYFVGLKDWMLKLWDARSHWRALSILLNEIAQIWKIVFFFEGRYFLDIEGRLCEPMYGYVFWNKDPWPKPRSSNLMKMVLTSFVSLKDGVRKFWDERWYCRTLGVKFHGSVQFQKVEWFLKVLGTFLTLKRFFEPMYGYLL